MKIKRTIIILFLCVFLMCSCSDGKPKLEYWNEVEIETSNGTKFKALTTDYFNEG